MSGDRQRARDRLAELDDGAPPGAAEYQIVRKDGTTVSVLISSSQIECEGSPALFSIMHDLTNQRQLEEQLRQTQRLESVGQLAGGVAHNFNNALAAIIGYSELIARRLDADDPVLADVQQILSVAEQAAALTRELLTFSRKERINPTVFDLNKAVESSRALLGPLRAPTSSCTCGWTGRCGGCGPTGGRWSKLSRISRSTRGTRCPMAGR